MTGVQNLIVTIENIGELVCDVAAIVKRGSIGIGGWGKLVEVVQDVRMLVESGTASLPELADVDSAEAGQLASAAYTQVKRIVAAVAAA